ncbi:MAG TPA: hypothetical protein ENN41_04115 [Sediminispirochaeta sp.]|nr:hypothetical protein [Sediminispirochaeta sp.]
MNKPAYLIVSAILLLSFFLTSCQEEEVSTAVLCTNRAEFTAYAETFNTIQDEHRIIISYSESPRSFFDGESSECSPDLVIDSFLDSQRYSGKFASLESLFLEEKIQSSQFYPALLSRGRRENQQYLLPVSFDLPGLYFKAGVVEQGIPGYGISLDQLDELNREFNIFNDERLERLGLSLRWQGEMLFLVGMLKGSNFRESNTGSLVWNAQSLTESVDFIRRWTLESNRGVAAERDFAQKYMVEPHYKLIDQERILCSYSSLSDFYLLPPQSREKLSLYWLSADDTIPILPGPLYAAIPQGAPGIKAAKVFLTWFFQAQNQEQLITSARDKRSRSFGIAGGLSSLPQVNQEILPTLYPGLVGRIPQSSYLVFPNRLPPHWKDIKHEVLIPWLQHQAIRENTDESFSERLRTWLQQRPSS